MRTSATVYTPNSVERRWMRRRRALRTFQARRSLHTHADSLDACPLVMCAVRSGHTALRPRQSCRSTRVQRTTSSIHQKAEKIS